VIGGGELLLPGEVVLQEDGSYTSPCVYAAYGIGLDAIAHRFHRCMRSRPQHPAPLRPVTLNVWEAVYFDHDLDRLVDLAERAAKLGVERYVLDGVGFALSSLIRYRRLRWVAYVGSAGLTVVNGSRRRAVPSAEIGAVRLVDSRLEIRSPDGRRRVTLPVDRTRPAHVAAAEIVQAIDAQLSGRA
jgi:Melibiase/Bacterial PH domain